MTFQELRKTRYSTAKAFSKVAHIPLARIQKWENGASALKVKDLRKVAQALEVSVEELLECFEK